MYASKINYNKGYTTLHESKGKGIHIIQLYYYPVLYKYSFIATAFIHCLPYFFPTDEQDCLYVESDEEGDSETDAELEITLLPDVSLSFILIQVYV